jgi:hypothetical protein
MRFATTDKVFSEDISPADHEGIRKMLHRILDLQIDRHINVLAVDLKHDERIATVDIRTFVHADDPKPPIIVKPHGGIVKKAAPLIVSPGRNRERTN